MGSDGLAYTLYCYYILDFGSLFKDFIIKKTNV